MAFNGFAFRNNTTQVVDQIARGSRANLTAAALIWHAGVIRELTGNRTGRTYNVPGTGSVRRAPVVVNVTAPRYKISSYTRMAKKRVGATEYRASAPGEAPASRTGDLRTSYRYRVQGNLAQVGTPLKYATALEKGTSKMAPRPHLRKAFNVNRQRILDALARDVI